MSSPRFLIIRGGAIGDFILTVPVIAAIRERWPSAHIEVLGYPHIAALAKGPELVNEVRSISSRGMATFFAEKGGLDPEFRAYFPRFQQIISFLYDPDQVFENNVRTAGGRRYLAGIHKPVEAEPPVHAARQLAKVLESLALYVENPLPKLYTQRAERLFAHDFFRGAPPRPLVAVHPGSGGEKKLWPAANWAELCEWLAVAKKVRLLLIGGEADQSALEILRAKLAPHNPFVAQHFKLPQLAAVLEQATLYVGHDSGISHLAAAVGVPCVVLFGPTNPAVWRPLGEKVRVLYGFREWTVENVDDFAAVPMSTITTELVEKVLNEMIDVVYD